MTPYPTELTTSDWVDWLAQPNLTRDEQIAALATCHRRVEYAATVQALNNLVQVAQEAFNAAITKGVSDPDQATVDAASTIPAPMDYTP